MNDEEYDFILWQMSMCSVVHTLVDCGLGVYRCRYCRFEVKGKK